MDVQNRCLRAVCSGLRDGLVQVLLDHELGVLVDGELDARPVALGDRLGPAARIDVAEVVDGVGLAAVAPGQHVVVPGFDACCARAVGVHGADNVRGKGPAGVLPLGRRLCVDADESLVDHLLCLLGGQRGGNDGVLPLGGQGCGDGDAGLTGEPGERVDVAFPHSRRDLLRVGGDVLRVGGVGERGAEPVLDRPA